MMIMKCLTKKVALLTALSMCLISTIPTQAAGKVGVVNGNMVVAKDNVFTEIATAPSVYIVFEDAIESGSGFENEEFYVEIANAEFTDEMSSSETVQSIGAISIDKEDDQVIKVVIKPTSRERKYYIPLLIKATGGEAKVAIKSYGGGSTLSDWGSTSTVETPTEQKPTEVESVPAEEIVEEVQSKVNRISFTLNNKSYLYNGESFTMDAAVYIESPGYMMIPVKYVSKVLGITEDDISFEKGVITLNLAKDTQLILKTSSKTCELKGEKITLDAPVVIKANRTYIPVGAVAKLLEVETKWDSATKTTEFTFSK